MATALLIVDLQNDYFPQGMMPLANVERAAAHAREVLAYFRASGQPVLHVQHVATRAGATFFVPGTAGVEIHASVTPEEGETLIQKHSPNGFHRTALAEKLKARDIDSLVIVGAMSHMCIDATTRAAVDLGFACTVLEDACATRDLTFGGRTVAAADVHTAFMAALNGSYAKVMQTAAFLANAQPVAA